MRPPEDRQAAYISPLDRFKSVGHRSTGDPHKGCPPGASQEIAHVAVDDATRFAGVEILVGSLRLAWSALTDQGIADWLVPRDLPVSRPAGKTSKDKELKLIKIRPSTLRTYAKVERFF